MLQLFWRAFKRLTLLTLPITIWPLVTGLLGGILFPIFLNSHVNSNIEKYLQGQRDVASDWGVGGGVQTFNEFQDKNNDFHLTRINSNDWASKLGFILPNEYSGAAAIELDTPIDKYASLDALMCETRKLSVEQLHKEQWVLLIGLVWVDWDGWNAAFDTIIRRSYTHPTLNHTKFHFAECSATASFLCGVWTTRAPALIHFLVEDEPLHPEEINPDLSYTVPYSNLRPVTVRIIELGLQEAYTGLPWTTFPTQEKQLQAIIEGDRMYEQFYPYDSDQQLQLRFNEYMNRLYDAKGTLLNHYIEIDWWMVRNVFKPLGMNGAIDEVNNIIFGVALTVSMLVNAILTPVSGMIRSFLGTPLIGDVWLADMEGQATTYDEDEDDPFGLKELLQSLVESASSESARTAAGGTIDPFGTEQATTSTL